MPAIIFLCLALIVLPLTIWGLFELQRMPYRPPADMNTFLGSSEIQFVRVLMGILAWVWIACAMALWFIVLRLRRDSFPRE